MSILVTLSNKLSNFIRVLVKPQRIHEGQYIKKIKFPRKKGVMLVIFKQDYNYAIERSFCCIFNESIIGCFVCFFMVRVRVCSNILLCEKDIPGKLFFCSSVRLNGNKVLEEIFYSFIGVLNCLGVINYFNTIKLIIH